MPTLPKLPDPKQTFYYTNDYGAEALHDARKRVANAYPNQSILTTLDGESRGKDTISLTGVDIEAELEQGTPIQKALSIVQEWAPKKRRDLHPDGVTSSIEYNAMDPLFIEDLTSHKDDSLSHKAAIRIHNLLNKNPKTSGRVPLSDEFKASIGPLEQVDVFAPLPESKKTIKQPGVHSAANILHYGTPEQQNQFAQNLEDTYSEGSALVVGPAESKMEHLAPLLQRHGFDPDRDANKKLEKQREQNPKVAPSYKGKPNRIFVYKKTKREK